MIGVEKAQGFLAARGVGVQLGASPIVVDVDLDLPRGELTVLVGPNGAGKTTLMRALAGLLPSTGTITVGGRRLADMPMRSRARAIAYLPQGHVFHWPMSVESVVALGRHPHADPFSPPSVEDRAATAAALAATGAAAFAARSVATLSGGECARVALARALATQAPVLFADEPTGSLDPRHQLVVMELLRQIAHDGGSVLAIVHDLVLAARFADRVLVMNRGRLVAADRPQIALSPGLLAEIFAVEAIVVEGGDGPVPLARRPI